MMIIRVLGWRGWLIIAITALLGFVNNAVQAAVAVNLAKLFDHGFAHETDPTEAFTGDALTRPKKFALFVLEIGLMFFRW